MTIRMKCEGCGAGLRAADRLSGTSTRCPRCSMPITVPQAAVPTSSQGWYLIDGGGRQFGPVPKSELDQWMIQGQITSACQVRSGADAHWRSAAELYPVLRTAAGNSTSSHGVPATESRLPNVQAAVPKRASVLVEPGTFWVLFSIWLVCYSAALVSCARFMAATMTRQRELVSSSALLYLLFTAATGIVFLVWIYKGWQLIQDGRVRTTPGRAVGRLLIPLYNLGWVFTAFPGLAADLNGYAVRKKYRVRKASDTLAWLYCTATLCSFIPLAGAIFAAIGMVVFPIAVLSITLTAAQIATLKKQEARLLPRGQLGNRRDLSFGQVVPA